MKSKIKLNLGIRRQLIAAVIILGFLLALPNLSNAQNKPVKNIVLVHGAFADGSGWRGVYDILVKKGYNVSIVQIPLTSLKDDIDATNRILDRQDGPVILVGHSWGGVVITEAGMNPKVTGLVYVAAYQPDKGENTLKWATSQPVKPEYGILPPDDKGFVYYDKAKFHDGFAGDLSKAETDFMFASQEPILAESFATPVADAAWKTKPAYGIVATEDKSINPDIERNMYKRSNTHTTEIKGSHVVFISHPDAVAKIIVAASENK